ncbi:MAG: glutamate 5-kinase [Desulfarculales bacterium]|jgi:glutamate 5-kinase|nr:glutamate 5-kinase [Desulfarculales bacterium]
MQRLDIVNKWRRIIVKVGSAVITSGAGLDRRRIYLLANQLAKLLAAKIQVVLVTSGAVASGRAKVREIVKGLERGLSIPQKQAAAALGQAGLMQTYEQALEVHGLLAAQILLTAADLRNRERYHNVSNTFDTLLEWGAVPIVNENDSVVVQEIKLGDNDNLAAMLTNLLSADLFINLTNVDGLFDSDPRTNAQAKLLNLVERVEAGHLASASSHPGLMGTGGILSKIKAADQAGKSGAYTIIANGLLDDVLPRLLAGEEIGTLFLPAPRHYPRRKHWIAFASQQEGEIVIDSGAARALQENGRSLLAAGIKEVRGIFQAGGALRVLDQNNTLIGVGLTNYGSQEMSLIMGLNSRQIAARLGRDDIPEAIHRDNLVLVEQQND